MSLYRTHRPKNFREVVGQEFVKTSLANALRLGKLAGAYLFYGSHGTGKTSVARIFAQGLNCLALEADGNPCGACEHCVSAKAGRFLDLIEIDGASYTGVDNVRDLIEKAKFQPSQGKYKVYIIDEVHMLSKGAFNALLKTVEEPPAHVKFILATTEIDKIPDTILSRSLRYDFKKIPDLQIVGRLVDVCAQEKITAEKSALELIARSSDGGLRDALTLLEQFSLGGTLSAAAVERDLGLTGRPFVEEFFAALKSGDRAAAEAKLASLRDRGTAARAFLEECLFYLRDGMVASVGRPDFAWWRGAFDAAQERWLVVKDIPSPFLAVEALAYGLLHAAGAAPLPAGSVPPKPTAPVVPASSSLRSAQGAEAIHAPNPMDRHGPQAGLAMTEAPAAAPSAVAAPQLFDAPALPQEPAAPANPVAPPKRQFFSGSAERPAATVRPAVGAEGDKPRVPKYIADMPAPKVPSQPAAPAVSAMAPIAAPAVPAPAAPVPFSLPAWADAAKKEGAKGSVALALKGSKAEVADGKAVLWAANEPNAAILRGATGVLEIAHRNAFGSSVAIEVRLLERSADLTVQASEIFG